MTTKKYFIANLHTDWFTHDIDIDIAPYLDTIRSEITRNLLINEVGEARDDIVYSMEDSNPFVKEFMEYVNQTNCWFELRYDVEELKKRFINN